MLQSAACQLQSEYLLYSQKNPNHSVKCGLFPFFLTSVQVLFAVIIRSTTGSVELLDPRILCDHRSCSVNRNKPLHPTKGSYYSTGMETYHTKSQSGVTLILSSLAKLCVHHRRFCYHSNSPVLPMTARLVK